MTFIRDKAVFIATIPAILAFDRATKLWAQGALRPLPRGELRLFPFLYLTYAENTGAAFSAFKNSNAALAAVSVLVLAGLLYYRKEWVRDASSRWGFVLVFSGALGNLYDRLVYGHVVDFVDLRVWPVFNLADSCITIGAILLALGLGRRPGPQ